MAKSKAADVDEAPGEGGAADAETSVMWLGRGFGTAVTAGLGGAHVLGVLPLPGGASGHVEAATPGSVDVAEIVANLNAGPRRTSFVRLKARLELSDKADEAAVQAAQPRIRDLFQTYLRDMRPEELRGSSGTYRLREELIARANVAMAPARVTEILFVELLIQ